MRKPRKRREFVPHADLLESRDLMAVGINLNFNYGGTPNWVDLTNVTRSWGPYSNVWDGVTKIPTDSSGYPLVDASTYVTMSNNPTGTYQFSYQGTGTFTFSGAGHLQSPVVLGPDGVYRGTVVVDKASLQYLLIYVSNVNPKDPIHDMHLMLPGYSTNTTQVFSDQYLQKLQPFSLIRTMNWSGTNGSTDVNWSDRRLPDTWNSTAAEVSWEDIIELGNEAHKDIWINVPALATDDYIKQLATLVHDRLDPSLNVYVEYSNETWNTAFPQYRQVLNLANANPLIDATTDISKVAEQTAYQQMRIAQIFRATFGADAGRVKSELAGWATFSSYLSTGLDFINRNFGSPSQYFNSIAISPYLFMASALDNSNLTLDLIFMSLNQALTNNFIPWVQSHAALAKQYGLTLEAYEGGQSLIAPNNLNFSLKQKAQNDPRMAQLYIKMLTLWDQYSSGDFVLFELDKNDGMSGFWGLLQNFNDIGSVKWDAVMRYALPGGDADLDGVVDWADFQIFTANYGKSGMWWAQGDFNGDGVVDLQDLNILKMNMDYGSLTSAQVAQLATYGQPGPYGLTTVQVAAQASGVVPPSYSFGTAQVFSTYGMSYVSDTAFTVASASSGTIVRDGSANGWALSLGGFNYSKGVSAYGNSRLDVALNGAYTTFQSDIGLGLASASGAGETFQVWGDGVLLYASPAITSRSAYQSIVVDVTGVKTLSLRTVMSGTSTATAAIAAWGAARLLKVPAGLSGQVTWTTSVGGSATMTTTLPSFVLRPSAAGVYTVTASDTVGGVLARSNVTLNIGPSFPGTQMATAGAGQVSLNWSSSGSGVTYVIYRSISGDPSTLRLYKSGLTGTSYIDTAVSAGKKYYYAIAAVSANGVQGPLSFLRSATPTAGITLIAGDATIDGVVNWADFQLLSANFGLNVGANGWSAGDFNGDGVVDLQDLNTLKMNMDYGSLTSAQVAQLATYGQPGPNGLSATQLAAQASGAVPSAYGLGVVQVYSGYGMNYVSDMAYTAVSAGSGTIVKDTAANGWFLNLAYGRYPKGVSAYGNSRLDVALNGAYTTFQSDIGLGLGSASGAGETFQVWGDGVLLYASPAMTSPSAYQSIVVDVTGVKTLSLRTVMSGTSTATAAIAVWGAARVLKVPAGAAGQLTWTTSMGGASTWTTTLPSFVFRPSAAGVYTVTASNALGGVKAQSSLTINMGPAGPSMLTLTGGPGQIGLTWLSSGSGVTYMIYRTTSGGDLKLYKSGLTVASFVDTAVTSGTKYSYAIAAVSANGVQGPLSNMSSATPS